MPSINRLQSLARDRIALLFALPIFGGHLNRNCAPWPDRRAWANDVIGRLEYEQSLMPDGANTGAAIAVYPIFIAKA